MSTTVKLLKKMNKLILIFTVFLAFNSFAQQIKGVVLSNTNEIIPYANIGVEGKQFGTVSDINGVFKLDIPDSLKNEKLTFSSIGYVNTIFPIKSSFSNSKFILSEDTTSLQEVKVQVSKRKLKTKILGNTTDAVNLNFQFIDNQLGNELGTLIKIKRSPTYIEDFTINIAKNLHKEVKFRLNIYTLKDDKPDQKILSKNVIITTSVSAGPVKVNLSDYNLVVEDDFIISIEWIENLPQDKLYFSAGMLGSSIFMRPTSQGDWERIKGVHLGMFVTVKY